MFSSTSYPRIRGIWMAVLPSVSVLAMTATAALAQDSPPPEQSSMDSADSPAVDPGEIVVTAQRREQSLSDVGISISVIGGDALKGRNIVEPADLAKLVPGLSVSDSGYSIPIYTLRGVGVNEQSLGSNSSVAVYVDEIPLVFPVMTQGATLDLQRVEVLKGPQGTLYGQNSTGGAINYVANKPTDEFQAGLNGTFGRFNRGSLEAYVSGPLTETLKARVALRGELGDGWQRSLTRSDTLGSVKRLTGRAIIDWKPSDRLKVSLTGSGWIDQSDTLAPQLSAVFPSSAFNVDRNLVVLDALDPTSCGRRGPPPQLPGCPINASTGTRVTAANQRVVVRPALLPGNNARNTDWNTGFDYGRDDNFYQAALRVDWDLSDQATLTSLTSFAHLKRDQTFEGDGTAISQNLTGVQKGTIDSFQQEFRLAAQISNLRWLVGVNLGHDKTNDVVTFFNRNNSANQNIFGFAFNSNEPFSEQKISSIGVFTSLDFAITSNLTLTGGIRLSQDDRKFRGCATPLTADDAIAATALDNGIRGSAGLPPLATPVQAGECYSIYTTAAAQSGDTAGLPLFTPGAANRRLKQDNVPWNINLNFKPAQNSIIYARVSRGFKAGNFTTIASPDNVGYSGVPQEKLTAYELGGRVRVGRWLNLEAAAFRYDYIDKQLRARVFVGPPFGNIAGQVKVPKSRIEGVEFAATLRPIQGLTLGASGTYIDSKIVEYVGQTFDNILQDQAGSPFNFTPKWSLNGDINYNVPIDDSLDAFAGVNVSYRSKTSGTFVPPNAPNRANLALFDIIPYTLVDAQVGIQSKGSKWKAFLWGKNIFDKYYFTNVVRISDVIVRYPGMPATYGITASIEY